MYIYVYIYMHIYMYMYMYICMFMHIHLPTIPGLPFSTELPTKIVCATSKVQVGSETPEVLAI